MENFVIIVGVLVAVLNLMLYVKILGACDDIKRIANKFAPKEKAQTLESKDDIEEWLIGGDEL